MNKVFKIFINLNEAVRDREKEQEMMVNYLSLKPIPNTEKGRDTTIKGDTKP